MKKEYSNLDLIQILHELKKNKTQAQLAKELNISTTCLSDSLTGRENVSEKVAIQLGFRKVCYWEKIAKE